MQICGDHGARAAARPRLAGVFAGARADFRHKPLNLRKYVLKASQKMWFWANLRRLFL